MSIGPERKFLIDDTPIQSVNRFKYLGKHLTSDGAVDAKLITRLCREFLFLKRQFRKY